MIARLLLGAACLLPFAASAQTPLTLKPERELSFTAREATWMALDLSPDGRTILFDLLGNIYALDVAGGTARPVLTGVAFETQPVFSPDGRSIAFLSDRSGATNLWVANADGSDPRKLSNETGAAIYSSPAWSPDGRFVYVSRTVHATLAFELFMFDAAGGAGIQVTKAQPGGQEPFDDRVNVLGAIASLDGKYLYYASKTGSLWTEHPLPHWSIVRRDLRTGVEDRIISPPGAAMRPALSHDGRKLVYASRLGAQTGLRIRDLVSGSDDWLTFPIDHDGEEGGYYNDLIPRVVFTPDDRAILTAIGGKITRIDLADGKRTPIPFQAPVKLALGAQTRVQTKDEEGPVRVRVIQAPRLSPDGRRVAYTALGTLYTQALAPGAPPVAVPGVEGMAYQPSWSPDGRTLVYVTWNASDGGHVWSVPANGGRPRRLTQTPAFYTEPAVSPDGRTVAVLRASQFERLNTASELSPARPTDIIRLALGGGEPAVVASAAGARALQFDATGKRLHFLTREGLSSVSLDGNDLRRDLVIQTPNSNRYFTGTLIPPETVRLSPKGDRALVKAASQLYLVNVPPATDKAPPTVRIDQPSVGVTRLTHVGADYVDWSPDGGSILWSTGATLSRVPVAGIAADAEARAEHFPAEIERPRDVPQGTIVLRGGTAITMRGDEVIRGADVVVSANRIVAVGPTGQVAVPPGAEVRDVSGKFLLPGFVDTHAHWFEVRREVLDPDHWDFLANLAYGVTSGLDVQPFTIDVFGYQDMIDAGMMVGPRAFSTGPGVFLNSEVNSKADALAILTRYRDAYRTRNIKSYLIGNRAQRQYMVEASKELGMMPTTEGASDFNLNLTHALDGFSGNEHMLPLSPLRDDVVRLYAQSRIAYTPTFNVMYGGAPSLPSFIIANDPSRDAKLRRFMPAGVVEAKMRGRVWTAPDDLSYPSFAADVLRIQRAGGLIGIGSHGELQGLGYHYELQAYAAGGATPMEVLHAATIGSAEVIGRLPDIGSLEPGKYADLLILDTDPTADIRNTLSIGQVMKNGRLYDAGTLDEVWPRRQALPRQWFQTGAPRP
ncbi:amidohydrolase family protein [Sphingomonas cannabina]|uniref:amidohydrolase family protein n=1 Tax=Sphingomonas cannabina TaxID=2899123 RepID=UPI001F1BF8AF|nr:amidohydrolase family protein [Sphingomonas cannabina]UIJ46739.1 amidohydrolase family protein [Sphingomonas cannabina]